MHALTLGAGVNAASGVLFIALGLFVAMVRASGRANRAFAVFAVAFGAAWVVDNLFSAGDHLVPLAPYTATLLLLISSAGLVVLASAYPLHLQRLPAATYGACVGVFTFVLVIGSAATYDGFLLGFGLVPMPTWTYRLALSVFHSVTWAILFLFALRYRDRRIDSRSRTAYVLMSAALMLYPAYFTGGTLAQQIIEDSTMRATSRLIQVLVLLLAYATTWIWSLRGQKTTRVTRFLPVLAMSLALAGMIMRLTLENNNPGYGVSRTLMVVVLGYAIVRHQLFGIDIKVKWTIRQSTVAAVFIGLFFVVSESAAAFFSDRVGTYMGIVAAGGLVFAIAPLQQFAQRVADRAMPGVKSVGEMTEDERLHLYRSQLTAAWADGAMSSDERRLLEIARDQLGIGAEEALHMEREVAP